MEKPDVKKVGLNLLEGTVINVVNDIVKPYAEYYSITKGGTVGLALSPFIDDLIKYLNSEIVDKIDGEDDIA